MVKIENIFLKKTEFHDLNTNLEIEPYINDFRLKLDEFMMLEDDRYDILKDYLKAYENSGILKITKNELKEVKKEEETEEQKDEEKNKKPKRFLKNIG